MNKKLVQYMFKTKSHNIVILLFALSVMLWGVFFNLSDGEKAHAAATYTISDTSTGGDCTTIGTWNDFTKTCTLTDNVALGSIGTDDGIDITTDDITLDCDGYTISVSSSTSPSSGVNIGLNRVTVKNCTISGFAGSQIHFNQSDDCVAYNNTVSGGEKGIYSDGGSGHYIINNTVSGANYGIDIVSTNNEIYGNSVSSVNFAGIRINNATDNIVVGNTSSGNSECGIEIKGSSSTNTIKGNTLQNNDSQGIWVTSDATGSGNLVNSNIITGNGTDIVEGDSAISTASDNNTCGSVSGYQDNGETGQCTWTSLPSQPSCTDSLNQSTVLTGDLNCSSGTNGLVIHSNVTLDCAGYSITGGDVVTNGLNFGGSQYSTAKNCTVSNFTSYGLYFNSNNNVINNTSTSNHPSITLGGGNNIISGNILSSSTGSGTEDSGIRVGGGGRDNNQILYNDITDHSYAFYWQGGTGNTIKGNHIYDNSSGGIIFAQSVGANTIEDNIIDNNGTNVGFGNSSIGSVIKSNVIKGGGMGITFSSNSTGNTLGGVLASDGNIIINNSIDISDSGSNDDTSADDNNTCNVIAGTWRDYGLTQDGCTTRTIATCGDGWIDGSEACDDGNTTPSDGCEANCLSITSGYGCAGEPSSCQLTSASATSSTVNNAAPAFTAGPSDGGSSDTTPNDTGTTVTFTATGTDTNVDDYYLAICKTDAITPGDNAVPTCTGGNWAITATSAGCDAGDTNPGNGACDSGTAETLTFTTSTSDAEQNDWYAFVCDKVSGGGLCSSSDQGSGDNGSPFVVNHAPTVVSGVEEVDYAVATELLTDGDMEAGDASAWTANTATLSKQTSSPHGGSRVLQVAYDSINQGFAYQDIFTAGKTYRTTGWARSDDGTNVPLARQSGGVLWQGTTSTEWQYFDEIFTHTGQANTYFFIGTQDNLAPGGYVEFDDVSVVEVGAEPNDRLTFNFEADDENGDDVTAVVCNANGFNDGTQVCTDGASSEFCRTTMTGGSQWVSQRSATFSLNDISCANETDCWTVGSTVILNTTNGGTNWNSQTSDITGSLQSVYFVDDQNGFAVGYGNGSGGAGSNAQKTTNGGTTWNDLTTGMDENLKGVHCYDDQICWAVGQNAAIIKTINGGANWTTQASTGTHYFDSIYCVDDQICWITGFSSSQLHKTTNGGTTWVKQTAGTGSELRGIHCINADNCWAVGNVGTITHTSDGSTWAVQALIPGNPILYDIFFANINEGWVIGSSSIVYKTNDGGETWSNITSGATNNINNLYFTDDDTGWLIGSGEMILKTTTGGVTKGSCDEGTGHDVYPYIDTPQPHDVDGTFANSPTVNRYTVHLFDEHDFEDDSSNENQFIEVIDVAPTVPSWYPGGQPSNPSLVAGDTDGTAFVWDVRIRDDNGAGDLATISGLFFDDDAVNNDCSEDDDNDCYPVASCSDLGDASSGNCSGYTATCADYQCTATVYYNSNASSNWTTSVTATDGTSPDNDYTEDDSVNFTIAALLGVELEDTTVAYGPLAPDDVSSAVTTSIGNAGNQLADFTLIGTDMCEDPATYTDCVGSPAVDTIGREQQEWTQSGGTGFTWGTENVLLETANDGCTPGGGGDCDESYGCANMDLAVRADSQLTTENEDFYWKIKIPSGQKAQSYQGTSTLTYIADDQCSGTP